MFDSDFITNPYRAYSQLRAAAPLLWADKFRNGAWLVTRYADVLAGLHDSRLSSQRSHNLTAALPSEAQSTYGAYSASPVVAGGVVYMQDLESNVQAVDLESGELLWETKMESPDQGPNGVAVAEGMVFGATATGCGGDLTSSIVITSVHSDEAEENPGGGDGNTLNDIVIAANCKSVQLRAERDSNLNGRVYTITFRVTDSEGNTTTATATVSVPLTSSSGTAVNGPGPGYTVTSACP